MSTACSLVQSASRWLRETTPNIAFGYGQLYFLLNEGTAVGETCTIFKL